MRRATFAFVFLTVLLDMMALGVVAPVLPSLVASLEGGNEVSTAAAIGWFGTVWAAMQFVFAPVIGGLSDRFGRRRVILLSCLGLGVDYVIMALAPTVGWLFIGRVLSGVTSSSFATSCAYVTDVTPPEERAGKFGKLRAAIGMGFIIGPTLGGLLSGVSLRAPFWAAAALSILGAVYGMFVLPESLPLERRRAFDWRRANPIGSLAMLRADHAMMSLAAAALLCRVAYDATPTLFVLYSNYRFGWTAKTVGYVLAFLAIVTNFVQTGLVGRIVARLGEFRAMVTGFACGAAGMMIHGLATTGAVFLAGIPVGALFALAYPSLQSLMTRRVAPDEQGRLQGAFASVLGLAGVIAPVLFSQVFALAIGRYRSLDVPGAPWLLSGLLLVLAIFVSVRGVTVGTPAAAGAPGRADAPVASSS